MKITFVFDETPNPFAKYAKIYDPPIEAQKTAAVLNYKQIPGVNEWYDKQGNIYEFIPGKEKVDNPLVQSGYPSQFKHTGLRIKKPSEIEVEMGAKTKDEDTPVDKLAKSLGYVELNNHDWYDPINKSVYREYKHGLKQIAMVVISRARHLKPDIQKEVDSLNRWNDRGDASNATAKRDKVPASEDVWEKIKENLRKIAKDAYMNRRKNPFSLADNEINMFFGAYPLPKYLPDDGFSFRIPGNLYSPLQRQPDREEFDPSSEFWKNQIGGIVDKMEQMKAMTGRMYSIDDIKTGDFAVHCTQFEQVNNLAQIIDNKTLERDQVICDAHGEETYILYCPEHKKTHGCCPGSEQLNGKTVIEYSQIIEGWPGYLRGNYSVKVDDNFTGGKHAGKAERKMFTVADLEEYFANRGIKIDYTSKALKIDILEYFRNK